MNVACWLSFAVTQLMVAAARPPITALALAPDGMHVVVGSQAGVVVHRQGDAEPRRNLDVGLPHVHDIAFSPEGQRLVVVGGRPSEYGELVCLAWPAGEILWRRVVHDEVIYRVAWHPAGESLAVAAGDHRVTLLAAETGEPLRSLEGHSRPVLALAYLPEGRYLVSGGVDHSMRVWDLKLGQSTRTLDQHTAEVRAVSLRPLDQNLPPTVASVGADRTLRFWQPTIGRLVRFARLPSASLSVAWLADGRHVAVGCEDGHVRLIDYESLEVIRDWAAIDGWVHEVATDRNWTGIVAAGGSGGRWMLLR